MGAAAIPILAFTIIWGIVGIALPFFVPKGPNRGILQVILVMTGFTCWLFWLCCYIAQMNPLIGPKLDTATIRMMAREWVMSKMLITTIKFVILPTMIFHLIILR